MSGQGGQPPSGPPEEDRAGPARVTVTIDAEHVNSMDRVIDALSRRGLEVDRVMEGLGMVTGSTTDPSALREVEGVAAVDREVVHRVAPPEEDLQ